jgi:hypothetical protein
MGLPRLFHLNIIRKRGQAAAAAKAVLDGHVAGGDAAQKHQDEVEQCEDAHHSQDGEEDLAFGPEHPGDVLALLPDVAEILLKVLLLFGDLLPDVAEATVRNPCVWARVVHPWQRRDLVLHFRPRLRHLLPHSGSLVLSLFQVLEWAALADEEAKADGLGAMSSLMAFWLAAWGAVSPLLMLTEAAFSCCNVFSSVAPAGRHCPGVMATSRSRTIIVKARILFVNFFL